MGIVMISMVRPPHNYSFQNGPILDSNPCPVSASLDQFKAWVLRSSPQNPVRQSRNQEEPEERRKEFNRKERIGRKNVGGGFQTRPIS
jgi:hypothetical protein